MTIATGSTTEALNRILATVYRSLTMYLADAAPWTRDPDDPAADAIGKISAEQRALCSRLADAVSRGGDVPEFGRFPLEYTGLNDLSASYLLTELIGSQEQVVASVESCIADLQAQGKTRALCEETLRKSREHLDMLRKLSTA